MIEFASINDKKELSSLWQMTFLEDSQVIEYFFDKVFQDTVTPVVKIDGEIVSALFLLPCNIGGYNGKCVYCAMTKYPHRGKGYMKELLDFSYEYCKENDFDFLFLVPAETSLFDYYEKCGFIKFGTGRVYTIDNTIPAEREKLFYDCEIQFKHTIEDYWKNACVVYDGKITDFGLVFDDEETFIRNAKGSFDKIPEQYKKSGTIIKGDINFGEDYIPAMIKTDNKEIKNKICYIGITLE
ncbi:MAG: GNAT family N-acetyltransferase [Clostridia bacterium]|nr:GNAT family N-acetyltransferase [Clostridia bacterium]